VSTSVVCVVCHALVLFPDNGLLFIMSTLPIMLRSGNYHHTLDRLEWSNSLQFAEVCTQLFCGQIIQNANINYSLRTVNVH